MYFGIYVHTQGPSPLRDVARAFARLIGHALEGAVLSEIDGLFLGLQSVSSFQVGIKPGRRKVRRDYDLRLVTGGSVHYACLVELDNILLADGEVIEAARSEAALFEYVRNVVTEILPVALRGFGDQDLQLLQDAVSKASFS
jgi:hypothetical protein